MKLNRKMRREAKKKLTDEQFEKLHDEANQEFAMTRAKENFDAMCMNLVKIMRKHRISEDRINAIFKDFIEQSGISN